MTPRISIGVPVYNGEKFLAACLDSILEQDAPVTEILISDNASTDATEEIGREYARRDDRIRFVRQPTNTGAAANHNFVIRNTTGSLYKTATHDDVLAPGFLRACVDALEAAPHAVLAFPRTRYIDADGNPIGDYTDPVRWSHASTPSGRLRDLFAEQRASLLHLCYPVMGLVRQTALARTRGIQGFQSSDETLLVELALQGDFVDIQEPLYLKRLHDDTSMRANRTPEEFARWFDPSNADRPPLPRTRLFASFLSAVARAELTPRERAACFREVAGWLARERRWRVIGGELKKWALRRSPTESRGE